MDSMLIFKFFWVMMILCMYVCVEEKCIDDVNCLYFYVGKMFVDCLLCNFVFFFCFNEIFELEVINLWDNRLNYVLDNMLKNIEFFDLLYNNI